MAFRNHPQIQYQWKTAVQITQKLVHTYIEGCFVRDLGVGKTCLRSQFVHHVFTNAYKATIGGDYLTTSVVLPSKYTIIVIDFIFGH